MKNNNYNLNIYLYFINFYYFILIKNICLNFSGIEWGLGIGDWGLGIWALGH